MTAREKRLKSFSLREVQQRALAFLPFSYVLFISGFFVVSVSKWHNNFFYVAVLFPFILSMSSEQIRIVTRSRLFLLAIAYLMYTYATLFWAENRNATDAVRYGFRFLYLVSFVIMTIMVCIRRREFLHTLLRCLCWSAGIAACISIVLFAAGNSVLDGRLWSIGRAYHPTQAGTLYCFAAIVCYYVFLKGASGKGHRYYLVLTAILLCAAALTQSRGPALALVVSVFFSTLLGRSKRTIGVAMVLGLIVAALLFSNLDVTIGAFERGDSNRLEIWSRTLEISKSALWLGHGIGAESDFILSNGTVVEHPHNIFLAGLFYSGIFGVALLLTLLGYALHEAIVCYLEGGSDVLLFALIIFSIVCGLTDNDKLLCHPKPLWVFFWLPIGLLAYREVLRSGRPSRTGHARL